MDGVFVDLVRIAVRSKRILEIVRGSRTFAILALKKDRTRNLNLSSSVCNITSVKLTLGSIVPVISSMVSIYTGCG